MNVVKEINRINDRELELGLSGASWHDEYKDSAYIFVGGLHFDLTEGDVITIFSQYGEVMDVNLPRDKETGKTKGFGFLMYEDQRSTVLAVDNLNGAKVLDRTLRVDHVRDYKQPKEKGADGELAEREEQSLNAKPEMIMDDASSESEVSSGPEIDPEDPMASYLIQKRKEEKALKGKKRKSSGKHKDETPEERKARKARKREKKAKKEGRKASGLKGVEDLLSSLGVKAPIRRRTDHSRSRTPPSHGDSNPDGRRTRPDGIPRRAASRSQSPSKSPPRRRYDSRDRPERRGPDERSRGDNYGSSRADRMSPRAESHRRPRRTGYDDTEGRDSRYRRQQD